MYLALMNQRYDCILTNFQKIFRSSASLKLDRCHKLTYSLTNKSLAVSSISPLFVDRFGRSNGLFRI